MLTYTIWGNSLLDIFISLAIAIGGFFIAKLIYLIFTKIFSKIASKTESQFDDLLINKLRAPFMFAAIIALIWFAIKRLNISEATETSMWKIYTVLIAINFTWAFSRLTGGILQNVLSKYAEKGDSKINRSITEILYRTTTYTIWIIGILVTMHNIGIEIGTLIAGLGIGGVAIALAAQDTVKNLLGGFMLFFDRPFNIGDRIRFGAIDGYVITIGLRSLRIRTFDDRVITIPNSQVVDNAIENVSSESSTRIKLTLGLTYDTTPEKMELAMNILRALPSKIPTIKNDVAVSFLNYGDFSMQILFIYFIKKSADYYETQSKVNIAILQEFNTNGLEFAFPTQTIYTKGQ